MSVLGEATGNVESIALLFLPQMHRTVVGDAQPLLEYCTCKLQHPILLYQARRSLAIKNQRAELQGAPH